MLRKINKNLRLLKIIKSNFKLKILLPVIAIYLLAGFSLYKVAIFSIKKNLAQEFQSKGKTIINTLAASIQDTILNRDASTLQGFLDQYKDEDGISFILILNESNKIVAHTFYPKVPDQYLKMTQQKAEPLLKKEVKAEELNINGHRELVLSRPILGGMLGHIYLGMGLETREKETIVPIEREIIRITSISVIIASFMLIVFLNFIFAPINQLTRAVESFIRGDNNHKRLPIKSSDEIGMLTNAFNEMLIVINNDTRALEEEIKKRSQIIDEQQMSLIYASKMSALGEMAGGIAHEINNPLTIISTTVALLKKLAASGKLDPEIADKYLTQIDSTIDRMAKIIQGLKTVSRDAREEEFEHVKLRDLMEDFTGVCSEKFKNNGIKFYIDLNNPLYDHIIECRRVQISQIFINLLGNAYDAIESLKEKWIKIECTINEQYVQFKISDSGKGIPLEIQKKIFQPFFTTKPIGKGTGLGLSLSNSIIEAHSGSFAIDNNCANTCFVITLPKKQQINS